MFVARSQKQKVATPAGTPADFELLSAVERILSEDCVFCDPGSIDLLSLSDGRQLKNDVLKGSVRYRRTHVFETGLCSL